MKLAALTEKVEYRLLRGTIDKDVTALIYFSEEAEPGCAFFAIPGALRNGEDYIREAVEKGAETILIQEEQFCGGDDGKKAHQWSIPSFFEKNITVLQVKDIRKTLAEMSRAFFGEPDRELTVIGITGTKGKTSTAYMLREILETAGIPTGLISTAEIGYAGNYCEAEHTTPQSADIYRWCRKMADAGCKALVMEVSSQGLMQSRVEGIEFDIGIFTNITPDHIGWGEHESFEEYLYWKSVLFKKCKKAIMNRDDSHWKAVLGDALPEDLITFGEKEGADLRIEKCRLLAKKDSLGILYRLNGHRVKLYMAGRFNAYNSAAAIAAAGMLGVRRSDVNKALRRVKVPGRVERVEAGKPCAVLVDYAHNGEALRKVLRGLREYHPKRLIVVFGCGGNRDRNRRSEMGQAAASLADFTVITSDNPRRENPLEIMEEIAKAMEKADGKFILIENRAEAIRWAVNRGKPGDIVLIAGKGHETYQLVGEKKIHFDDREVIASMKDISAKGR